MDRGGERARAEGAAARCRGAKRPERASGRNRGFKEARLRSCAPPFCPQPETRNKTAPACNRAGFFVWFYSIFAGMGDVFFDDARSLMSRVSAFSQRDCVCVCVCVCFLFFV